jgi:hypothetical protein
MSNRFNQDLEIDENFIIRRSNDLSNNLFKDNIIKRKTT